jgi:hypothetical protein
VIILSGLLVVGAIALLVLGIYSGEQGALGLDGLQLIYISIAVSVVSALCLAIGVLIRRKELFGGVPSSRTVAKSKAPGRAARQAAKKAPDAEKAAEQQEAAIAAFPTGSFPMPVADVPEDALVYVVQGRKRYHLDSCRQLADRETEELTYVEAREEGFTPCTACLPDTALAARATVSGGSPAVTEDVAAEAVSTDRAVTEEPQIYQPLSYEAPSYGTSELDRPSWSRAATESPDQFPPAESPLETRTDMTLDELKSVSEPAPFEFKTGAEPAAEEYEEPAPFDFATGSAFAGSEPAVEEHETADDEPVTAEFAAVPPVGEAEDAPVVEAEEEAVEERPAVEYELPTSGFLDPAFSAPIIEAVLAEAVQAESLPEEEASEPVEETPEAPVAEAPAPISVPEQSREPEPEPTPEPVMAGPLVRILSGTKRYHRPDCALIEDIGDEIDDLESLGRDDAKARGCTPCLVCQPDKEHAV